MSVTKIEKVQRELETTLKHIGHLNRSVARTDVYVKKAFKILSLIISFNVLLIILNYLIIFYFANFYG